MQKHHWYVLIGFLLASCFFPFYDPAHGAGLGIFLAGVIDWVYASLAAQK